MFEALLVGALAQDTLPLAEAAAPRKPSIELLEFLGEFGDDDDGLFDGASEPAVPPREAARKPVLPAKREPSAPKETP